MGSGLEQWLNQCGSVKLKVIFYLSAAVLVISSAVLAGVITQVVMVAVSGWLLWLVLAGVGLLWLLICVGGVLYLSMRLQGK